MNTEANSTTKLNRYKNINRQTMQTSAAFWYKARAASGWVCSSILAALSNTEAAASCEPCCWYKLQARSASEWISLRSPTSLLTSRACSMHLCTHNHHATYSIMLDNRWIHGARRRVGTNAPIASPTTHRYIVQSMDWLEKRIAFRFFAVYVLYSQLSHKNI